MTTTRVLAIAALACTATVAQAEQMGFLKDSNAGDCFAKVSVPAKYETVTQRLTLAEPSEKIEITAAEYRTVKERVLIAEESFKLVKVPARYETVSERIMVEPAREEWRTTNNNDIYAVLKKDGSRVTKLDSSTGQTLCKVKIPAKYKTITKRVMASAPTTKRVVIPAKYRTMNKRIVARPAQERRVVIPGKYKTIEQKKLVHPESVEWVPVLCKTNVTRARLTDIQVALKERGLYPGPIDGIFGRDTLKGLDAFQRKEGLTRGGLTLETIRALGVNLNK